MLVPSVELEDKIKEAELEAEGIKAVNVEDKDISTVLVPSVELEDKTKRGGRDRCTY